MTTARRGIVGHPGSAATRQALGLLLVAAACTPRTEQAEVGPVDVRVPQSATPTPSNEQPEPPGPPAAATLRDVADDEPLQAGLVRFTGMARPTKGGVDVRGVTLDSEVLRRALVSPSHEPWGHDELLGARLRLEAELVREGAAAATGVERVQQREGEWWRARRLLSAQVLREPEVIEGVVTRSKGLFAVSGRLIERGDLAWALASTGGDAEGARVRVWGQPRTVVCPPNTQCLTDGELPLFDVGRAELLSP